MIARQRRTSGDVLHDRPPDHRRPTAGAAHRAALRRRAGRSQLHPSIPRRRVPMTWRAELGRTRDAIRAAHRLHPVRVPPALRSLRRRRVIDTARSLGLATVLWNDDPSDWALPGTPATIVARVLAQVQPRLDHHLPRRRRVPGGAPAAYPTIIAALRARGSASRRSPSCSACAPCMCAAAPTAWARACGRRYRPARSCCPRAPRRPPGA